MNPPSEYVLKRRTVPVIPLTIDRFGQSIRLRAVTVRMTHVCACRAGTTGTLKTTHRTRIRVRRAENQQLISFAP